MAIAHVQSVQASGTGSNPTVNIAAAGVGNLLIINLKTTYPPNAISTINDGTSNAYALALGPISDGTNSAFQFYGVQTSGGATTITVPVGFTAWRMAVSEFSGTASSNAAVFDQATSGSATSASAGSVPSFAPLASGSLIVAAFAFSGAVSAMTAGANYALAISSTSQSIEFCLSSTTTETAPMTWTGTPNYIEVVGSYVAYSTPPPGPPPVLSRRASGLGSLNILSLASL